MKDYLTGLLTNYLGLAISILIQVFLLPFLLNHLGSKLTGIYYLFMTISNFIAVGIGWLSGAGVFLLASMDSRRRAKNIEEIHWTLFIGHSVYATLAFSIIGLIAAGIGSLWLAGAEMEVVRQAKIACLLLGLYIWIHYIHQADIALYMGTLKQGWANFYRVFSQIVFICIILLLVVPSPRLDILMLANVIGVLSAAVSARLHLRISGRLGPVRWHLPDRALMKKVFFTKGGSYFVFGIAQFCLNYGDVLIIGAILGPEMVSSYLVIWKIPEVAALILSRISEILSPYLTQIQNKLGTKGIADVFICTSRFQHLLAVVSGLAYGLFGPILVGLWVGMSNRPEQPYLYWLAGGVLAIQVVNRHDVVLHYALAKLGNLVGAQFIELALKLLLMLVFFRSFGIAAPLIAALMVNLAGLTWFYRAAALRLVDAHWKRWVSQVCLWPCVVLGVASGGYHISKYFISGMEKFNFIISFSIYLIIAGFTIAMIEHFMRENGLFYLPEILKSVSDHEPLPEKT